MDVQTIEQALFKKPFQPFELVMNDGRAFRVDHPELLTVSSGNVALTVAKEGYVINLEPLMIASMALWLDPEPPLDPAMN